jgi:hypothetical protein
MADPHLPVRKRDHTHLPAVTHDLGARPSLMAPSGDTFGRNGEDRFEGGTTQVFEQFINGELRILHELDHRQQNLTVGGQKLGQFPRITLR